MTVIIDIVGTDPLYDEFTDVDGYLKDIADFSRSNWQNEIKEDGEYGASYVTHTDIRVDSSAFETDQGNTIHTLEGRRVASRSYLEDNWDLYDSSDAILVVDHHPYYPDSYGTSYVGGAGNIDKVCLADAYIDTADEFSDFHENIGMKGTCQHEILHEFDATHEEAFVDSRGNSSIMGREGKSFNCSDRGVPQIRTEDVSTCNESDVQNHIDSHSL